MRLRLRTTALAGLATVVLAACAQGGRPSSDATGESSGDAVKLRPVALSLTDPVTLNPQGALNPTVAVDPKSGAVYMGWAQEGPEDAGGDPRLTALVARSDDGGKTFGAPVAVSVPGDKVVSYTVSPVQVATGAKGEVFVLYLHNADFSVPGWEYGRSFLRLARSDDGGKTFGAPVDVAGEAAEGARTSMEMATLFVGPDGDLFVSWLDFRAELAYLAAPKTGEHEGHGGAKKERTELRVARSSDGGRTFGKSVLVAESVCGCCGTRIAQAAGGPLYASTRSAWAELKESYDAVRDPVLSVSHDDGATWSKPTKISDDRFKISGCPDVTPGLATDSKGRLHAAWYTGTEKQPGVFYSVSSDQGKTFSKPVVLFTDKWIPYADVKLAIDGKDHAWVAFEDRRTDNDAVVVVEVTPEGKVAYSKSWPGHAPDIVALKDSALVAWATKAPGEDEGGGAVQVSLASPR